MQACKSKDRTKQVVASQWLKVTHKMVSIKQKSKKKT